MQNPSLCRALILALLGVATTAGGQLRPSSDYYFDRSDSVLIQQLQNVEKFHLPGCSEGLTSKRFEAAVADCEFILRYFPNHPKALLTAAELCSAWKSARCNTDGYFEAAIAVNPRVSATYTTKGVFLLRANRVVDAIGALKQAAALDPGSINAQYNLGLAYLEAKQYDLANRHAQRAYQLGAPVPGLRDRLKKAGYWKPEDVLPPEAPAAGGADAPKN